MAVTTLSESRSYAVAPERAYAVLLPLPLEQLFTHRHGVIPPIREVRDAPDTWNVAGQSRTIVLADGGRMTETLTEVDPPRSFAYRITSFRGPLALLASHVDGRWSVDPEGDDGCRVTWTWQVHRRLPLGPVGLPVFTRFWNGYAAKALDELERHLATA